jgi:hypothetical protein
VGDNHSGNSHAFMALPPGTRLDSRYTIESVIGAGGFGITYIARHDSLGRAFAIKEHFHPPVRVPGRHELGRAPDRSGYFHLGS